jgi:hypothetical protein
MASIVDLLTPLKTRTRKPTGMQSGMPVYGYGNRYQEESVKDPLQPKGLGYFGEMPRLDDINGFSGEIGIGNEYGEHPSMVPGLSHRELVDMLSSENVPISAMMKADKYQMLRKLQGKSPFATINDKQTLLPLPIPESSLRALWEY